MPSHAVTGEWFGLVLGPLDMLTLLAASCAVLLAPISGGVIAAQEPGAR